MQSKISQSNDALFRYKNIKEEIIFFFYFWKSYLIFFRPEYNGVFLINSFVLFN